MQHIINGEVYSAPPDQDGMIDSDDLRRLANIPSDRPLLRQRADGSNQVINPGEKIHARGGDQYVDAPLHRRGS